MKKDVTQKQREMLGRPLAIADAECYTGISEGERERSRSIDCPGLGIDGRLNALGKHIKSVNIGIF